MSRNIKIPIREINIEKLLSKVKGWEISDEDKKDLFSFFKDLEIGKVTGNIMKPGTLSTYIINLRISLEFLKKPISKVEEKDIDKLCESLLKNKLHWDFKKKDKTKKTIIHNRPYTESTKLKIKDSLIKYLGWKLKDDAISFIKILKVRPRIKDRTPDYLKEGMIEELYKGCKTAEERFLVAVLFDSGARAEEFHNIRFEDIEINNDKVRLTLKEEYSKTKGRSIGLYWKYSFEAVSDYLKERMKDNINPKDQVFKKNYKSSRAFLQRLGLRILNRNIYYHLFRHSSATYYASKLNRQQLCIRYGWKFRSPMPDRYIARDGMENREIDEKFEKATINDLKEELQKVKEQSKIREDKLKQEVQNIMLKTKEELRKMLGEMIIVKN
ncbi:site-specific integrase [Candidatus Pacearchaeota archaeon]|nr:site-specific integrase [Candidatus Pacearchaeota archaeon]